MLVSALPTLQTARTIWSNFPASFLAPNHATVIQDYTVMWVSGRMVLAGAVHALASAGSFNQWIGTLLGPGIDRYDWLYPPPILLLSTPLALLPPLASFAAWTVLTLALLWAALRLVRLPLLLRVAVMLSPATLESVVDGQNGALLAAALVGGLALAPLRPGLAGLWLSILIVKPQLGLIAPVCLLASRNWRAIGWAMLFSACWLGLTVLCFGIGAWTDYVLSILPDARARQLDLDSVRFGTLYLQNLVVTPFALVRSLGGRPVVAEVIQSAVTVVVFALVWRVWSRRRLVREDLKLACALAAVPLVSPYALSYDMIGPALACVILIADDASAARLGRIAAAWFWPGVAIYVGLFVFPGLGTLAFGLLALAAWRAAGGARGLAG